MTLVADANVPDPIIRALQAIGFDIKRLSELGSPAMPDREAMKAAVDVGGILLTADMGIPSQAYLFEYAKAGLTVVLLRWKTSTPEDWQQIVETVLRDAHS